MAILFYYVFSLGLRRERTARTNSSKHTWYFGCRKGRANWTRGFSSSLIERIFEHQKSTRMAFHGINQGQIFLIHNFLLYALMSFMRSCFWFNFFLTWVRQRYKCAYLLKQSTTTRIVSLLWEDGKPAIKSIVISSHTWQGTGKGWRSSAWVILSILFF